MRNLSLLFYCIILFYPSFAQNEDLLNRSNELLVRGNSKGAFDLLNINTINNDSKALYQLALYYQQGVGTDKNDSIANYYFNKSAELGFVEAQKMMAYRYMDGIGCKADKEKAFYQFKTCSNNNTECMLNYINCIFQGIGTNKDLNFALDVAQKYILNNLSANDMYSAEIAYFIAENNFYSPDSLNALKWILIANEYSDNLKYNYSLKTNYQKIIKNNSNIDFKSLENELKKLFNKSELNLSNLN